MSICPIWELFLFKPQIPLEPENFLTPSQRLNEHAMLHKRILSTLFLLPIIAYFIHSGGLLFALIITIVIAFGLYEFFGLLSHRVAFNFSLKLLAGGATLLLILNRLGLHISERCWCDTIPGYFGLNYQKILNLLIAISRLVSKSTLVIVAKKCGKNFVSLNKRGTTLKWRWPNDIIAHNFDIAIYTQFSPFSSDRFNRSSLSFPSFSSPSPIISIAVK